MGDVKLFGAWPSGFSSRVIWGLKLKGIPFEYVEEDLSNKSPLLLQFNPVHKKIPVLVHQGKPICESMIILEYLEETWPQNPLLPTDPYERAVVRFWVKFIEDKGPAVMKTFQISGEEQQKAVKDTLETLTTIEEKALGDKKFFGGDKIGMLDLACGAIAHWFGVLEEVTGLKLLEAEKFPRLVAWTKNFKEEDVIKENIPDRDKLLRFYKRVFASPSTST